MRCEIGVGMSEKTTSEFMLEIASHYLINGCDGCPFYSVTKTCDSKPINCNWMALRNYFKAEESKEESEPAEPEMITIEEVSNQLGCATIQSALYWFEFLKTLDLLGFAIIRKETK